MWLSWQPFLREPQPVTVDDDGKNWTDFRWFLAEIGGRLDCFCAGCYFPRNWSGKTSMAVPALATWLGKENEFWLLLVLKNWHVCPNQWASPRHRGAFEHSSLAFNAFWTNMVAVVFAAWWIFVVLQVTFWLYKLYLNTSLGCKPLFDVKALLAFFDIKWNDICATLASCLRGLEVFSCHSLRGVCARSLFCWLEARFLLLDIASLYLIKSFLNTLTCALKKKKKKKK